MDNLEWVRLADPLRCLIDTHALLLEAKVFKSGSRGWHHSSKITIADERVQVSICATVIGSKPSQTPASEDAKQPRKKKAAVVHIGGPGSKLAPEPTETH